MSSSVSMDRLAMRSRPEGSPVMHQNWENLLFLHWPVDPALVRPLIPEPLEIDTFEGKSWIGITPFALSGLRLLSLPEIPGLDSFLELNVRTYVHYKGMPGVWFFSLDASRTIPVMAARLLFQLPYHSAEMKFVSDGDAFAFSSRRSGNPAAQFRAGWRSGQRLRAPDLESLAFFLVERYALFAVTGHQISMTRVYHAPWILDEAILQSWESTLHSATGLPEPGSEPLAYFSRMQKVDVWAPVTI